MITSPKVTAGGFRGGGGEVSWGMIGGSEKGFWTRTMLLWPVFSFEGNLALCIAKNAQLW